MRRLVLLTRRQVRHTVNVRKRYHQQRETEERKKAFQTVQEVRPVHTTPAPKLPDVNLRELSPTEERLADAGRHADAEMIDGQYKPQAGELAALIERAYTLRRMGVKIHLLDNDPGILTRWHRGDIKPDEVTRLRNEVDAKEQKFR